MLMVEGKIMHEPKVSALSECMLYKPHNALQTGIYLVLLTDPLIRTLRKYPPCPLFPQVPAQGSLTCL